MDEMEELRKLAPILDRLLRQLDAGTSAMSMRDMQTAITMLTAALSILVARELRSEEDAWNDARS